MINEHLNAIFPLGASDEKVVTAANGISKRYGKMMKNLANESNSSPIDAAANIYFDFLTQGWKFK